jgi:tetratricopeptide (TPR) repeat protein
MKSSVTLFWALVVMGIGATPATAQIPDKFTNLRVLPKDISRDSLLYIMRRFSLSLGVRCQFCHVGGDGVSFEGVQFPKDDDAHKRKARFMLRMVDSLNRVVLPTLPDLNGRAPLRISCKTCHRGSSRPLLLTQRLAEVRDSAGIAGAVTLYRELRQDAAMAGRYDFGEWEVNLWAEELAAAGHSDDAIAVYQLNLEFFPESVSIWIALGRLYESKDRAKALEYYTKAQARQPNNPDLKKRIEQLKARPD